ncbi:MAG: protein translocase subunit SecD [Simkania sp.]|nr:protein translocase subunit SecD [Simkania sp.]
MEAKKRWHFWLIIAVLALTIYNILPTIFFYTKPLHAPIDASRANKITTSIAEQVNGLEGFSKDWLSSYCKLLHINPLEIYLDQSDPELLTASFSKEGEAKILRKYLPRAGNMISFTPAQLSIADQENDLLQSKKVTIKRRIPLHFDKDHLGDYYQFSTMTDAHGEVTPLYKALIADRILQLGVSIAGSSENAKLAKAIIDHPQDLQVQELAVILGQRVLEAAQLFGEDSTIAMRFYSSLTQGTLDDASHFSGRLLSALSTIKDALRIEKIALQKEQEHLKADNEVLATVKKQRLELLSARETVLNNFEGLLRKYGSLFQRNPGAWNYDIVSSKLPQMESSHSLSFEGHNPVIETLFIDWPNGKILLKLHPDIIQYRAELDQKKASQYLKDQVDQIIYNQIAAIARSSSETITPFQGHFVIELKELSEAKSFLTLRLSSIARQGIASLKHQLDNHWHPSHLDLQRDSFPIWDYSTYLTLSEEAKNFGLVIYSPAVSKEPPPEGMKMNSIYVIARGLDKMIANLQSNPESEATKQFFQDFNKLRDLLQQQGFYGYSGKSAYISPEFSHDFFFEKEDYYQDVLKATRENFLVKGTRRFALLEFSNVEQRILAENEIDNQIHEDLLKWRDDYHAASLGIKGVSPYDIPKPTQSAFLSNFKLSCIKFFRGDDRKILHWGLDISGGKTVQIELRDANNHLVTKEADLRQGMNELYDRVNKMGVSEVSIRQEGHSISLDFPGSQAFSAAELVKASSMYFHILNEKFSLNNPTLSSYVEQFLQDIWNEAVVTGRKHVEEINAIAWKHLHGDSLDPDTIQPRSAAARILYEQGLRLSSPQDTFTSSTLDESISKIAIQRGNDFTDWHGHSHPLMIVFRNFALEGSNLENVAASYDPSKGNFINFSVKNSPTGTHNTSSNPRDDFEAWTSRFCKEKIAGTPLANYSNGEGWRMTVVLNGSVISAPTLNSPLRNNASITGSFTQREVAQLEADLKAGSLSFTPRILSEKNVSPELGNQERYLGILGMFLALILVVVAMISYYRFAGLIASVAVFFNLLIMWAALQNIQATMTLAGIAGIILTLGMSVDANVLVFERIREEFAVTGRIASAVHVGYRKAFSAIFDSNITTLIAALILLNFESGPIKAIAVTLIIGLASSMFTALFMTRYFFARWVQNPSNKKLNMANCFKPREYNFLKYTKPTVIFSALVILFGGLIAVSERHTLLGMDFTGGYALSIEVTPQKDGNYRQRVEKALMAKGATSQDILVRELHPENHLRLFLASSMEQSGHPFYAMPLGLDDKDPSYPYATNPRIVWVVNALQEAGMLIPISTLDALDQSWSSVSGQMSDTMRNQALIGLIIAFVCILIYITIRFEFTYAASATLCLLHDMIFTVAVIAILYWLGVPLQIDLHTVAALMTIVGYSLNDTIIIFDRIREDMRATRKRSVSETINHALNITLSRTLMTSGTTLLVLLPLLILGGSTIFSFALVMAIGVIFGTLSSLFIAAPLMLYFHQREVEKQKVLAGAEH